MLGLGFSAEDADLGGDDGVSGASSSKSNAFAVVGDSGGASDFCYSLAGIHVGSFLKMPRTSFSGPDMGADMIATVVT